MTDNQEFWTSDTVTFLNTIGLDKYTKNFSNTKLLDIHDLPPWILEDKFEQDSAAIEYFLHKITEAKMKYPYEFEYKEYPMPIKQCVIPMSSSNDKPKVKYPILSKDSKVMLEALNNLMKQIDMIDKDEFIFNCLRGLRMSILDKDTKQKKYLTREWNKEISVLRDKSPYLVDNIPFLLVPTFGSGKNKKHKTKLFCKCIENTTNIVEWLDNSNIVIVNNKNYRINTSSPENKYLQLAFYKFREIIQIYTPHSDKIKINKNIVTRVFKDCCFSLLYSKCSCGKRMRLKDIAIHFKIPKESKWSIKYLHRNCINLIINVIQKNTPELVFDCPKCKYTFLKTNRYSINAHIKCRWCSYTHINHFEHRMHCPKCNTSICEICKVSPYHTSLQCRGPNSKGKKGNPCPKCNNFIEGTTCQQCNINICEKCYCEITSNLHQYHCPFK